MTRTFSRGYAAPLLLAVLLGALLGAGLFTVGYARGYAYLTDRPAACANCHVMRDPLESWMKSSHGKVAVCNDCHTPPGFVAKYATKALNGFFHSLAFTTGRYPDEILITHRNYRVTQSSCLKCHADMVEGIQSARHEGSEVDCITCHRTVGHM
jgi:cytochrome c nitrite reductase small subunit